MKTIALLATSLVAVLHVYFMVVEMFLWNTPYGRRVFGLKPDFAAASRTLAMNQGLYNGFLAAGLGWGLGRGGDLLGGRIGGLGGVGGFGASGDAGVVLFFLGCVVVAGVFGAVTANRKILFVQALPGAVAFALVWAAR